MSAASRRWPAEWEAQCAVMLTWPHRNSDWQVGLAAAEAVFLQIALQVTKRQSLLVSCADEARLHQLADELAAQRVDPALVRLFHAPANDCWSRDHGPLTVIDHDEALLLNFRFDGWGGKYPAAEDDALTGLLADMGAFDHSPMDHLDVVLEGGAIDGNGAGLLLTTRDCLLRGRRNANWQEPDYERLFAETLGVEQVIWLDCKGLEGDDTDGHIDTIVRFCQPDVVAYTAPPDSSDAHQTALAALEKQLQQAARKVRGGMELLPLPLPAPQFDESGQRMPATYANFLIINDAVLVPVYATAEDDIALKRLQQAFPGRSIEPIDCRALIAQHGSLHCVTMQLPEGVWQE